MGRFRAQVTVATAVAMLIVGAPVAAAGATTGTTSQPLAQGGTFICTYGSNPMTNETDITMAAGTSGTINADPNSITGYQGIPSEGTSCTLSGVIPSGWNVSEAVFPFYTAGATVGNAGTLTVSNTYVDAANNMTYAGGPSNLMGGAFENEGSIVVHEGTGYTWSFFFSSFTNLPGGTIDANGSSTVIALLSTTTLGSFVNEGAVDVGNGDSFQVGSAGYQGTDFTLDEGGTIALGTASAFDVVAGALDIEGGTVSGGPITSGGPNTPVTFGSSVPSDSTGALSLTNSTQTALTGVIPQGWTVASRDGITAAGDVGNAGTLQFINSTGAGIVDTGTFTNYGTIDVQGGTININTPDFVNAAGATFSVLGASGSVGAGGVFFDYDNAGLAGTVGNSGTIDIASGAVFTVGPRSCATGEHFFTLAGSTLDDQGSFAAQCGLLDLDGGAFTGTQPLAIQAGTVTVNFDSGLGTGTGTAAETLDIVNPGATVEGTIPAGWTFKSAPSFTVAPGTDNAGTMVLTSGFIGTGTFTNSGTITVPQGSGADFDVPDFVNASSGLVQSAGTAPGGSQVTFNYDNPTTPGVVDNSGTLSVNSGETLTLGTGGCQTGEKLILEAGSTVIAPGTFNMDCGQLQVNGGQITPAGPIQVQTGFSMAINFATGLPTGTGGPGDTIVMEDTKSGGLPFTSSIPAGWTIDEAGGGFTIPSGDANNGTLVLNGGAGLLGPAGGTFVNNGIIDVTAGISGFVTYNGTVINAGTVTLGNYSQWNLAEASFINDGTVNLGYNQSTLHFDNFTQSASGTLGVSVNGVNYGDVYASSNASVAGTLALTTVATPTQGAVLNIVYGAASLSGRFSEVTGLIAGGGLAYQADYSRSGYVNLDVLANTVSEALTAASVTGPTPASPYPGQLVTGSFTVTNTGTRTIPAEGWDDSVYLGTTPTYQAGDTLLERIDDSVPNAGLAPGASYTDQISASLPTIAPGTYYLIAVPDSESLISPYYYDQPAASAVFSVGAVPTLTPGTQVTASGDGDHLFQVPLGFSDVSITVTMPTRAAYTSANIYAYRGTWASPEVYQLTSLPGATFPTVVLPSSAPGTWYVDVVADALPNGATFTVDPEVAGLAVTGSSPGAAGNNGPVTVTITGSGFGPDLSAELSLGLATIQAEAVTRVSSTTAFATFPMEGELAGTYALTVTTGSKSATFGSALLVNNSGPGELQITSGGSPQDLRYGWIGIATVTMTNNGGSDVYLPEVVVSADPAGGVDEVLPYSSLTCGIAVGSCGVTPGTQGFEQSYTLYDPAFTTGVGQPPLPPGVLPPGDTVGFAVGVEGSSTDNGTLPVTVTVLNSTDTGTIDWYSQLNGAQPGGLSNTAWQAVEGYIADTYGSQGRYAAGAVGLIQEAQADGVPITDDNQLSQFLLQKVLRTDGPLGGTLIDTTTGGPLGNAKITFTLASDPSQSYSTTSWYDGTYSFWGVPGGTYDVTVAGELPRSEQVTVPAEGPFVQNLSVFDGATVAGTVTQAGGSTPIAGVTVTATDADGALFATTAADGSYSIAGLDPGSVTVTASAPGWAGSSQTVTGLVGSSVSAPFSLSPGATLSGTVTNPGGALPGDLIVWAAPSGGAPVPGSVGSSGTFTITGLAPGTYTVLASSASTGEVASAGSAAVATGATVSGISLTLDQPGSIAGQVTDAATGTPLTGVTVWADALGDPGPVTTDSFGDFTLTGLVPGTQDLTVVPAAGDDHTPQELSVAVIAGQTVNQNVALAPYGTITAVVEDAAGAPIPGATLTLAAPSVLPGGPNVTATSHYQADPTGTVSTGPIPAGIYEVQVDGTDVQQAVTIDAGHLSPSVILQVPAEPLTGQVLLSGGSPAPSLPVQMSDATGPIQSTTTGPDGSYTFWTIGRGPFDVVVDAPGAGILIAPGLAPTGSSPTTAPTLQAGSDGLTVSVSNGSGPVPGAVLTVTSGGPDDDAAISVAADVTGTATIPSLTQGFYTVGVADGTDQPSIQTVDVTSAGQHLSVTLAPSASISGTVTQAGHPVAGSQVTATLTGATPVQASAVTASDGSYTVTGLDPGTYNLSAQIDGQPSVLVTGVVVGSSGTVSEDLTLPAAGSSVTLDLTPASAGGPVPAISATVLDAAGTAVGSGTAGPALSSSDPAAQTTIGPLGAGSYTVALSGSGRPTVTETVSGSSMSVAAPAGEAVSTQLGTDTPIVVASTTRDLAPAIVLADQTTPAPLTVADLEKSFFWNTLLNPPDRSQLDNIEAFYQSRLGLTSNCVDLSGYKAAASLAHYEADQAYSQMVYAFNQMQQQVHTEGAIQLGDMVQELNDILSLVAAAGDAGLIDKIEDISLIANAEQAAQLKTELGLANIVGGFQGFVAQVQMDIQNQNASGLSSVIDNLQSLGNLIEQIAETAGATPGALAAINPVSDFFNKVKDQLNQLQAGTNAINGIAQDYNTSKNVYQNALNRLLAALNDLRNAASTPCPPPPPNPPQLPPPNTTVNFNNDLGLDPNGLDGTPGAGSGNWVLPGSELGYVVHFQNDPTASASVAQVTVTDQVPSDVDPSSLQLTGFGFGPTSIAVPPGLQSFDQTFPDAAPNSDGDSVEVQGGYDPATSTITWTISAIDPHTGDVDYSAGGGFLPPDSSSGVGEGYVSFIANLKSGLASGTAVSDQATITFDRNPPISTPTWTNTVDATTPTATVASLPTTTPPGSLPVSWSGADATGPGVATYNVFVSTDGGPLQLWQSVTSNTSGSYDTVGGHTYGFAAQATDLAGVSGPVPTSAQTTTTASRTVSTTTSETLGSAYYSSSMQQVPVSATVDAGTTPVSEGTVTFTVYPGSSATGPPLETSTPIPVSSGSASTGVTVPAGLVPGSYLVLASYSDSTGDYASSSDDSGSITVNPAPVEVTVTGGQAYGGSPTFNVTTSPPGISVTGVSCTSAAQGSTTAPISKALAPGVYTLGGCTGNLSPDYAASFVGSTFKVVLDGLWAVTASGHVVPIGPTPTYGSLPTNPPPPGPVVGLAVTPDGGGYWLVTAPGTVYPFGDASGFCPASHCASEPAPTPPAPGTPAPPPPGPVVGIAANPAGSGYWLVTANGAIYNLSGAKSYGSLLTKPPVPGPVVGLAVTPDGGGYWLVTAAGTVYPFGDASGYCTASRCASEPVPTPPAHGTPPPPPPGPVVGIAANTAGYGYWLVTANGVVVNLSGAPNLAPVNAGTTSPPGRMIGIAATPDAGGYWVLSAQGSLTAYGDAGSYVSGPLPTGASGPLVALGSQ